MTDELPKCNEITAVVNELNNMEVVVDTRGARITCKEHPEVFLEATRFVPPGQRKFVPELEGWFHSFEMDLLYEMAFRMPAEMGVALEIGSWKGRSTSAFALASPVICIDTFNGSEEHTKDGPVDTYPDFIRNLTEAGLLANCIILRAPSDVALPLLKGTKVRIALVDGSHETDQALRDLNAVWDMLVPGGIMFVDDIDWASVKTAAVEFSTEHGVEWSMPITGDTKLGMFAKEIPKDG